MTSVNERARLALLAALLLATPWACGAGPPYVPLTPVQASARPAALTLASIGGRGLSVVLPKQGTAMTSGLTVRLRWHALAPGTGIARAFLVPPALDATPCTAGIAAELIEVDGQIRWDRPAGLGADHDVAIAFPADSRLGHVPLDLDVQIVDAAGTSCVTLPLTGEPQRYRASSPLAGTTAVGALSTVRAHRRTGGVLDYALGRWVGPLRLTLRFGFSFGQSFKAIYPGTFDSTFFDLHVAPEVALLPIVRGKLALGVSAAYVLGSGVSGAGTVSDPERDTDYSGPRLAVIIARVDRAPLGTTWHRPEHLVGLELSLLRASAWPGDPLRGATYVVGLGFIIW